MSSKKRKRRPWSWQAEACRCVCVVRVGAIHRLDRSRVRVRVCEQNTEQPLAGQQATPSTTTPSSSLSPFRDSSCASGWTRTRCHSKPHPQLLSDLLNTASQAAPSPPIRCHPPPPQTARRHHGELPEDGEGRRGSVACSPLLYLCSDTLVMGRARHRH